MNVFPDKPTLSRLFRLQWEEAQNSYVLLYPEGMVKLNQSAGEILKRWKRLLHCRTSPPTWKNSCVRPTNMAG